MDFTRRDFLKTASAATLSALVAAEPRVGARRRSPTSDQPKATADTLILLWMAGGMAAPETFDPKRYQPFEVGLPVEKVMSTFPAIDTAVDNIKICEGLENIAKVMDRATLDPFPRAARPGAHSALAASISLAHRLRAAANRGRAASGGVDRQSAGAEKSGHSGVHRHRPATGKQRREGRTQSVSHRGLSRHASSARSRCRFPIRRSTPCGRRRG